MRRPLWLLPMLLGALAIVLTGCGRKKPAQPEARPPEPTAAPTIAPTAVPAAPPPAAGEITGLRFTYDNYSGDQFCLNVYVEGLSDSGAQAEISKRVGPMNYTGQTMEGTLALDAAQVQRLREILGSRDLAAWSALPTRSSGSSPSRSLIVFSGEEVLYDVRWDAVFPETLPPEEDVFYCELYNFFNGVVSAAPGWEAVRSPDLDDPRADPAYTERSVTWFGKEVKLVPGTGVGSADGRYAEIDYEGRSWWVEEGFTGRWTLDRECPTDGLNVPERASLKVFPDGSVEFKLDDTEWKGTVSAVRRCEDSVGIALENEKGRRACEVGLPLGQSYDRVHVTCYPGPVPEPQFDPIDVYLMKLPEGG